MKTWKWTQWVLALLIVATTVLILWQSLLPAEQSMAYSNTVAQVIEQIEKPAQSAPWRYHVREWGHVIEFALLGMEWAMFGLASRHRAAWFLLPGVALTVVDEVVQHWVPGRATELIDMALDAGGYLTGWLVTAAVLCLVVALRRMAAKSKAM